MPQRRLAPPRVRAFVDFLAERWRDNPPGASGLDLLADGGQTLERGQS
jgi:hypothetical protein